MTTTTTTTTTGVNPYTAHEFKACDADCFGLAEVHCHHCGAPPEDLNHRMARR